MNFSPFGTHFPSAIPGIHQFASSVVSSASQDTSASRYHSGQNVNMSHFNQAPILGKFRGEEGASSGGGNKYNGHSAVTSSQYGSVSYSQPSDAGEKHQGRNSITSYAQMGQGKESGQNSDLTQDITALLQQTDTKRVLQNPGWQSLAAPAASSVADYLSHLPASTLPLSLHHFLKYSAENIKKEAQQNPLSTIDMAQAQSAQTLNLNNLTSSLLPAGSSIANIINQQQSQPSANQSQSADGTPAAPSKARKKKKKPPKEKKPRPKPGEIRVTTALDGSTLYQCPECQVAYPERGILEQHMVGHNMERRFICDICNAALKRKDHLTRHKQSHNPERPFVCTICLKAFKRKEQLTLHVIIHSGEKRHVCTECGKGFYRKDHLRKHTRSHIARRVKAELSSQQPQQGGAQPAGGSSTNNSTGGGSSSTLQTLPPASSTAAAAAQSASHHQQQSSQSNNPFQSQLQQQIQQAQQLHAQLSHLSPPSQLQSNHHGHQSMMQN